MAEDRNLVTNIQRKFNSLQSLTGILATQRPHLPIQHLQPNIISTRLQDNDKQSLTGKRPYDNITITNPNSELVYKSLNLGWNSTHNGRRLPPVLPIPPLYPYAEVCDTGHAKDTSSYENVGKTRKKRNIDGCNLEMISDEKHEVEIKPSSSVELQEQREFLMTNSSLNHAAELELEIRMMNSQENKTLALI